MAQKVNVATKKTYSLKKLAKKRKHIGTGDGGVISKKMLESR
mgnify:CR=1 FL=1